MSLHWEPSTICFFCKKRLSIREVERWAESGLKTRYIHCDVHVEEAFQKSRDDTRNERSPNESH